MIKVPASLLKAVLLMTTFIKCVPMIMVLLLTSRGPASTTMGSKNGQPEFTTERHPRISRHAVVGDLAKPCAPLQEAKACDTCTFWETKGFMGTSVLHRLGMHMARSS